MSLALSELVDETTFKPGGELAPGLTGQRISGARVVLEWIVRSWLQARGANRLAPNSTVDLRDLENATLGARELESWRVSLVAAAKAAAIGYLAAIDVALSLDNRTVRIRAVVQLVDGSTHRLAVALSAGTAALVKFGD